MFRKKKIQYEVNNKTRQGFLKNKSLTQFLKQNLCCVTPSFLRWPSVCFQPLSLRVTNFLCVILLRLGRCHRLKTQINNSEICTQRHVSLLTEFVHEHDLICCQLVNMLQCRVACKQINKIKSTSTQKHSH